MTGQYPDRIEPGTKSKQTYTKKEGGVRRVPGDSGKAGSKETNHEPCGKISNSRNGFVSK